VPYPQIPQITLIRLSSSHSAAICPAPEVPICGSYEQFTLLATYHCYESSPVHSTSARTVRITVPCRISDTYRSRSPLTSRDSDP